MAKLAIAALALTAIGGRDPVFLENAFRKLDAAALARLDDALCSQANPSVHKCSEGLDCHENYRVVGRALLRRFVHRALDKRCRALAASKTIEDSLRFHKLPGFPSKRISNEYGEQCEGDGPPSTWYEALQYAQRTSGSSKGKLWRYVLDHPMTEYVPVQCPHCGRTIPDDTNDGRKDEDFGLEEVVPTAEEKPYVQSGWFRGPRGPVVFSICCVDCGKMSRWFRSIDPGVILNPNGWGRLCGEQEDLRLCLADYLGVTLRTIIPLDWDHIWSEYQESDGGEWNVQDGSARNFACRLDEGIGAWTAVLAVGDVPESCGDVTQEYLRGRNSLTGDGRLDSEHTAETTLTRYRGMVQSTRRDGTGTTTQSKTLNGYILWRAGLTPDLITLEMQRAARDHGIRAWWQLPD